VRPQLARQQLPEQLLRRPERRAITVGDVEVGDPEIEGVQDDLALGVVRMVGPEFLPEAEREDRQVESARSGAPEGQLLAGLMAHAMCPVPILDPPAFATS
jgi:hypothetical protein